MENVQFNEENQQYMNNRQLHHAKGMTGWLIKKGLVKSEVGAKALLVVVIFVCIVASALVWIIPGQSNKPTPIDREQTKKIIEQRLNEIKTRNQ
jgi:hypothetical protein